MRLRILIKWFCYICIKKMAFKIYTKTGDKGETSLFGGKRLPKNHIRIESYGTVDELNAWIGLIKDHLQEEVLQAELYEIQNRLFTVGANLASDPEKNMQTPDILESDISMMEQAIDRMETTLPALKNFILPGGHPTVSYCHLARCVCRRAERMVVALSQEEQVEPILIRYLNRLSDYLFVLGRKIAQNRAADEVIWKNRK